MPNTYKELLRTTVGTATPSVTLNLTGISGYTDLVLIINGTSSASENVRIQFNSDTGTNYSNTVLYGNGTSALSTRNTSSASLILAALSSTAQSTIITNIMN